MGVLEDEVEFKEDEHMVLSDVGGRVGVQGGRTSEEQVNVM